MSGNRFLFRYLTVICSFSITLIIIVCHRNHTNSPDDYGCNPATKIAFMKTHKCASSTIENILFRYAYREDLNVVAPLDGNHITKTELLHHQVLQGTPWANLEMHLLALHARWNHAGVMRLLGPESPRTFTILRDPVDLFESLYAYHRMNETYGVDLKDFVQLIKDRSSSDDVRNQGLFGRNQMAWDLGLDPSSFEDREAVWELIRRMETQFDLVMIADRMEESLVLLRHLLCWPVEDMAHLDRNVRKRELTIQLDLDEREVLRRWLGADSQIYNHFVRIFDSKVKRFSHMGDEVRKLFEANRKMRKRCVLRRVGNEELSGPFQELHNGTMGYLIDEKEPGCDLFAFSERTYLDIFRERMTRRAGLFGSRK